MYKILSVILAGLTIIGGIFSAIFYVLFKQKKEENQLINEAYLQEKEEAKTQNDINNALNHSKIDLIQEEKENEELQNIAHGKPNLSAFNACNELMSKH